MGIKEDIDKDLHLTKQYNLKATFIEMNGEFFKKFEKELVLDREIVGYYKGIPIKVNNSIEEYDIQVTY